MYSRVDSMACAKSGSYGVRRIPSGVRIANSSSPSATPSVSTTSLVRMTPSEFPTLRTLTGAATAMPLGRYLMCYNECYTGQAVHARVRREAGHDPQGSQHLPQLCAAFAGIIWAPRQPPYL